MKKMLILLISIMFSFTAYAKEEKKVITLTSDNTLSLSEDFNSSSVTNLMQEAAEMDANLKSGYPMYLFMYTPGGSIQDGLELIEFFNGLNRPVHTITLFSASMGWQTVQHLGKRYIMKYGVLMSHKARGSFSGEFGGGISQLDSRYQLWIRRMQLMDKETVKRTNGKQSLKSYTNQYTPELWLNGGEAVEKGYADAVVTVKCDPSLKGTIEKVMDYGFFKIIALFSKCPMKTSPLGVNASLMTNQGEMSLKNFLSKNGKFGPSCQDKELVFQLSAYTEPEVEQKELCAMDKTLTLKQIIEKVKERQAYFNRNLRDHIVYSY